MVRLQGEANANKDFDEYKTGLDNIVKKIMGHGVEQCLLIQIGNYMSSVNQEYLKSERSYQTLTATRRRL